MPLRITMKGFIRSTTILLVFMCINLGISQSPTDQIIFVINEEVADGSLIGDIAKVAKLEERYPQVWNQFKYDLTPQSNQNEEPFRLNEDTGRLYTSGRLDRDLTCPGRLECDLYIDVAVVQPRSHFMVFTVQVTVIDINDNDPVFTPDTLTIQFPELASPGIAVGLPQATDLDGPQFGVLEYHLLTDNDEVALSVDRDLNGEPSGLNLVLQLTLDREKTPSYEVHVACVDRGSPARTGTLTVDILVEDANDHKPIFDNSSMVVYAPEDFPLNGTLLQVHAADLDAGDNAKITYDIITRDGLPHNTFYIDEDTGEISLLRMLDFEQVTSYDLRVAARDGGSMSLSAICTVTVTVLDVNDNWPDMTVNTFTSDQKANVKENSVVGEFVAHIAAFDADAKDKIRCTVDHPDFVLSPIRVNQYKLLTSHVLDRENATSHSVPLLCADMGEPAHTSSVLLTVMVLDENDNTPSFIKQDGYVASIPENNEDNAFILRLNATDADSGLNSQLVYSFSNTTDPHTLKMFSLHEHTGIIRATEQLDYEMRQKWQFVVGVSDQGVPTRRSSTITVDIFILDENDEPPRFKSDHYSFSVEENKVPGGVIGQVAASDLDTPPRNTMIFSFINDIHNLFHIDKDTGEIRALVSLDREITNIYELVIVVVDKQVVSLQSSSTGTVYVLDQNDNRPIITYPNANNATLLVSSRIPVGSNVVQVLARDDDIGSNSRLHYELIDGRTDLFSVNATTGQIVSVVSLEHVRYQEFGLRLIVQDGGTPALLSESIDLYIVVDHTVAYVNPGDRSGDNAGGEHSLNLRILIVVAVVSAVVVFLVILAIILVRICDLRKTEHHIQTPRAEAETILRPPTADENQTASQKSLFRKGQKRKNCPNGAIIMETSNNRSNEESKAYAQKGQRRNGSSGNHQMSDSAGNERSGRELAGLEAHLLGLLRSDQPDSESWSSGDTADSGRGPSEHGEHHNHHQAAKHRSAHVTRHPVSPVKTAEPTLSRQPVSPVKTQRSDMSPAQRLQANLRHTMTPSPRHDQEPYDSLSPHPRCDYDLQATSPNGVGDATPQNMTLPNRLSPIADGAADYQEFSRSSPVAPDLPPRSSHFRRGPKPVSMPCLPGQGPPPLVHRSPNPQQHIYGNHGFLQAAEVPPNRLSWQQGSLSPRQQPGHSYAEERTAFSQPEERRADTIDPDKLQAHIDELFFKGFII